MPSGGFRVPDTAAKKSYAPAKPAKTRNRVKAGDAKSEETLWRLAADRIVIEGVSPEIDGGRFPAKSTVGHRFEVEADIFGDGHDKIDAALLSRFKGDKAWHEAPMVPFDNDRWRGAFRPDRNGPYEYTLIAWRDLFASWREEVSKKHAAGQPISLELEEGRRLVAAGAEHAPGAEHVGRRGGGKVGRRRPTRHPLPPHRLDARDGGLLEHHLADQDGPRRAVGRPPRQVARGAGVPGHRGRDDRVHPPIIARTSA